MKARLDDKKLGQVLRDRKYYRSGIRSDYPALSIELEESYNDYIVSKMLSLYNKDLEYDTPKHLENLIYDTFKKAFLNAVKYVGRDKRRVSFVNIDKFIETSESEDIKMPENMKHKDVEFDNLPVDEIDIKLSIVKELLSDDEYNYLDLRLNAQCSVAEVKEVMEIDNTQVDDLLRRIKRKCKHLRTEGAKYTFTPYGDYDKRNTLELFHMSEELKNQYVSYASSNKLAIHIEESYGFAFKRGLY